VPGIFKGNLTESKKRLLLDGRMEGWRHGGLLHYRRQGVNPGKAGNRTNDKKGKNERVRDRERYKKKKAPESPFLHHYTPLNCLALIVILSMSCWID
jgi:hypothetical protein